MSAAELLTDLAPHGITLDADGKNLRYYAAEGALTPVLRERIKTHKTELLVYLTKDAANQITDPAEKKRRKVLSMLADNPDITDAFTSDDQTDPEYVIITLAIRGQATCDLRIPKDRYDGPKMLELIEQHTNR